MTDTPKVVKIRRAMKYKAMWRAAAAEGELAMKSALAEVDRANAALVALMKMEHKYTLAMTSAVVGWLSFLALLTLHVAGK